MIEPKSRIKNIRPSAEKENIDWRLKLDENINIYGTSKFAVSALRNFPLEQLSLYPALEQYREKFGKIYNLDPEQILFTNSSDSAMGLIINTYLDNGDKIISNNPSYEKLSSYALYVGGSIEYIEFGENYTADINKIREKLNTKVKICYLSTPNDITGEILRVPVIKEFLAEFRETLFVVDISNLGFVENVVFNDYTDMTDEYSNIIIIKSFANDYALAGLGVGIIISNSRNIEALKILSPDFTVSLLDLNCAISAINDTVYFETIKQENAAEAENLYNGLVELGFKPAKTNANFILCDFEKSCEFYYNKLKTNGVITKNFKDCSAAQSCLRMSVPKHGGVKYLLRLLSPKDVLIFAFEDTLFDVKKSYYDALIKTFEHFANRTITIDKIKEIKRARGCDFLGALYFLFSDNYIGANMDEIKAEFQKHFSEEKLIDNDRLLIKEEILEQLSLHFDMALIGFRAKEEMIYSLKKENLEKFFPYINNIDFEDFTKIEEKIPHKNISFIVANDEILSVAKNAGIKAIALIAKENNDSDTINNLKHLGADYIIHENESILKHFGLSL